MRIAPEDPESPAHPYTLDVSCDAGCDLEYTRYPVVLMHGMAGTETYINVLDYWFQLEDVLMNPGFHVQIRDVEAFQGTQVRGAQWLVHIEAMLAQGLGRKFNLIGHSQGGIDARLVAATKSMTGRIASVVTVSAPHHGSPTAQVVNGTFDLFPIGADILDGMVGIFGGLIGLTGDDLAVQIADFTPEAMEIFNADYPNVDGIYYASYAGKSLRRAGPPLSVVKQGGDRRPGLHRLTRIHHPRGGRQRRHGAGGEREVGRLPGDHPCGPHGRGRPNRGLL